MKAVDEMPRPTCKKELATLLGFLSYLSKFLPPLAEITQPLRDLTAKDAPFLWSPQHESAFASIKQLVADHPVLKFYDPGAEVNLQYDASEYGLGATLLQGGQPVAFASRTLSRTERNYARLEKEFLAIVLDVSVLISISPERIRSQTTKAHIQEAYSRSTMPPSKDAVATVAL